MDQLAERLRSERERQGRTLSDLSAQTKIREPFLEAIELGRYGVLPPVYVRSFIRTYAQALRIPTAEVQTLIERILSTDDDDRSFVPTSLLNPARIVQATPPSAAPSVPIKEQVSSLLASVPKPSFELPSFLHGRRGLLIMGGALLVVVVATTLTVRSCASSSEHERTDSTSAISVGMANNPLDSMILTAIATDTSWMTITMDEKRTQQMVILPGQEHRWSAMQKFQVALGNAGALTFSRNGSVLPPLGKMGEAVRSVTITRTEVNSSASAARQVVSKPPVAAPPQQQQQRPVQQQQQRPVQQTRPAPPVQQQRRVVQRAPVRQPQRYGRNRWRQPVRKPAPVVRRAPASAPRRPAITTAPVIPR